MTNADEPILTDAERDEIRAKLDDVAQRAEAAAKAAGRGYGGGNPEAAAEDVKVLLAVKTQPVQKIRTAIEHGYRLIGENRQQELTAKAEGLADLNPVAHLIGPLQRNKVNHTLAVESCTCIESIDNMRLAQRIDNRLQLLERDSLDIFIQVNTSREDSKFGVAPEEAEQLIEEVRGLEHLRIRGLMTIGLPGSTADEIRPSYADLRELSQRLRDSGVLPTDAVELSMGMSADFELAIEEGATIVRVGSSVFGARD